MILHRGIREIVGRRSYGWYRRGLRFFIPASKGSPQRIDREIDTGIADADPDNNKKSLVRTGDHGRENGQLNSNVNQILKKL